MIGRINKLRRQRKKFRRINSVIAAVGLTAFKIVVGIMTGSLGILAEALHSGLDLVAALVTLVAVRGIRETRRPRTPLWAWKSGKFIRLVRDAAAVGYLCMDFSRGNSAFIFKAVEIDASIWGFIVMGVSIVIDYSRSKVLYHAAKKHNSQALEADALHFSTDIWSSTVVIFGLFGVWLSDMSPSLEFLHMADAVAAMGVARS